MANERDITQLRTAAEAGEPQAQFELFMEYSMAEGHTPQSWVTAAQWCKEAAERGHTEAQFYLGQLYRDTNGLPQSFLEAHKWFNLAAVADAEYAETAAKFRDELAERMTPDQIAEAQRQAVEFKPQGDRSPG